MMLVESVACAADGKTFFVEKLADAPYQQNLVMLIVAAVAAALERLQLGELLLPITQDMRLDATQIADFSDREIALRRDWRQFLRAGFRAACLHH